MLKTYFFIFLIAFGISYLLTPLIRILSLKMGWLDKPNYRKINTKPMPLLGGLAIFISYTVALLIYHALRPNFMMPHKFWGMLSSSLIVVMAGYSR